MDERALSFREAIFKILCLCPLYNSCVRERERRRIIDILNLEQAGNHNDEEGKKAHNGNNSWRRHFQLFYHSIPLYYKYVFYYYDDSLFFLN